MLPTRVVRFDVEKESPVRGADGLCIECDPDEVGEAHRRHFGQAPGRNFEGYTKASDTEKKILHDVFRKGDAWFRTGDLMRRDEHGYFYFVDRIGDTYRWKGENVATSEVTEALFIGAGHPRSQCLWRDRARHGWPRRHGGAGGGWRISISPGWRTRLEGRLPPYARPVFLRLQPQIEVTGTFKQRKVELVKEGFDPGTLPDPLFWLNPLSGIYERPDAGALRRDRGRSRKTLNLSMGGLDPPIHG